MENNENNNPTLRSIIARVVDPKLLPAELHDEIQLQGNLNIDSAMLVDIVLDMEECYSIHVPDQDLDRLRTVGDLLRLIPAKQT